MSLFLFIKRARFSDLFFINMILATILSTRLQAQPGYFTSLPVWFSGEQPNTYNVAFGDIDRDGDLDLVCGNSGSGSSLYENVEGTLTHMPTWSSSQSNYTVSIALGDVDGDGDLDLVCGNYTQSTTLYENAGETFSSLPVWSSGQANATESIALGDIDGDGDLDLVCGNYEQSTTLYENNEGVFSSFPVWSSGQMNATRSIALGDVDGDGDLDLVCGNYEQSTTLYENIGGTFSSLPVWSSGLLNRTYSVALGDIDGNGELDLVCGNQYDPSTVYNNIRGTFSSMPAWYSGLTDDIFGITLGDVDGDGDLDLACGSRYARTALYRNNGGILSFMPVWSSGLQHNTNSIALGDVDGDGYLDLVCGNWDDPTAYYENIGGPFSSMPVWSSMSSVINATLGDIDADGDLDLVGSSGGKAVFYTNIDGTFSALPVWSSGQVNNTRDIALGDVDRDGDLDLVCGNYDESITLYENTGGTFSSLPTWSSNLAFWTEGIALGDVDRDGDLDLVCGNDWNPTALYENEGGTFSSNPIWYSKFASTRSVAFGDVDKDGDLDLICGNDGYSTLYENAGTTLSLLPIWSSGQAYYTLSVAFGDIDGDGDLDLVNGNYEESSTLYENQDGMFSSLPVWSSGQTSWTASVALGDVEGDGDLDLICGNYRDKTTLYENEGGTFSFLPVWTATEAKWTSGVKLGDVDQDGDLDLVCGNAMDEGCTLHANLKNPAYKGDPTAPNNHLPSNGAFISRTTVAPSSENHCLVTFTICDADSDRIWIVGDYQFEGEPVWRHVELSGGGSRNGPIIAAPEGTTDSLEWDFTRVPFDRRNIVLRLRTVEIPRKVSIIQHASSYLKTIGTIVPIRPEITCSADSLLFSQTAITVGDTTSRELVLFNTGTLDLQVDAIKLPSFEMRVDRTTPFVLHPGQADTMTIFLEPHFETDIMGTITIESNDPVTPSYSIIIRTDIRQLKVLSELLRSSDIIPLGEAVTVVVTPAPQVNIERGYLHYRPAGAPSFLDSIPLSRFKNQFVAVIPGEAVTEGGIEYFIRVENSGVFGTDPPGAPAFFYTQAVEPPSAISVVLPNPYLLVENRMITLTIELPQGAVFHDGVIHYRRGGETSYDTNSIYQSDDKFYASIPNSMVGARGMEYWVEVHTLTHTLTFPTDNPIDRPSGFTVTVRDLQEPDRHAGGTDQKAYRMMTIPLTLFEDFTGTIEALLSDQPEFGSYDPMRWRVWRYLTSSGRYEELSDETASGFRPEPGAAYWLICKQNHRISTAPIPGYSVPTHTTRCFSFQLEPKRWNMIGCPYAFPVSWDSVLVDSTSYSEAVGMLIDPPVCWMSGHYSSPINLDPFEGYWVYNRTDEIVTLQIPAREAAQQAAPQTVSQVLSRRIGWSPVSDGWQLNLAAEAAGCFDRFNAAGTAGGSYEDLDRNDRFDPPPPPGGLSLYFMGEGEEEEPYRYAVDMRPEPEAGGEWGEVWAFDVMKAFSQEAAGDAVTVLIDSIASLPPDAKVVLVDRTLDRQIALEGHGEYTFYLGTRDYVASEEAARFRLIVGSELFVEEEASKLIDLPTQAALYQNYPNPFNPSTIIRYDVAEPGQVNLRIYSVTGALVKVLEARHRDRGRYELGWNGENELGEQVASGIYFYRLTAPGYSQTRKMVLVR